RRGEFGGCGLGAAGVSRSNDDLMARPRPPFRQAGPKGARSAEHCNQFTRAHFLSPICRGGRRTMSCRRLPPKPVASFCVFSHVPGAAQTPKAEVPYGAAVTPAARLSALVQVVK